MNARESYPACIELSPKVNDPIHDQIQVLTNEKAGSASTFAFTAIWCDRVLSTLNTYNTSVLRRVLQARSRSTPASFLVSCLSFFSPTHPFLLVLGTATWHLTRSASLVSQALRSSGGGISLPHNTFRDTTFSSSRPSESHVILISISRSVSDFAKLRPDFWIDSNRNCPWLRGLILRGIRDDQKEPFINKLTVVFLRSRPSLYR